MQFTSHTVLSLDIFRPPVLAICFPDCHVPLVPNYASFKDRSKLVIFLTLEYYSRLMHPSVNIDWLLMSMIVLMLQPGNPVMITVASDSASG